MNEIVNRVADSKLITFNLEDLYPEGKRETIDISQWLYEGFILREKDFREQLKKYDWTQHEGNYIALYCSADAILPAWAFMLVTAHLAPYAKYVVKGDKVELETRLFSTLIDRIDVEKYRDQLIIIKGCTNKPVPENAYLELLQKLQPVVKSLMFGEACSAVPLYKKK
ncbi:DUF2480 family protein [Flavimarina sp. Hel_I_48]|uniref:DUF2480 family protein n=1 Tax=Flavimarina sp. Hel_I_48 TaxID=1392488 RepID=UPI0004DF327D|nr:DUF2480 family protein [Flavimarina sp. Hel_I_48]